MEFAETIPIRFTRLNQGGLHGIEATYIASLFVTQELILLNHFLLLRYICL